MTGLLLTTDTAGRPASGSEMTWVRDGSTWRFVRVSWGADPSWRFVDYSDDLRRLGALLDALGKKKGGKRGC